MTENVEIRRLPWAWLIAVEIGDRIVLSSCTGDRDAAEREARRHYTQTRLQAARRTQ